MNRLLAALMICFASLSVIAFFVGAHVAKHPEQVAAVTRAAPTIAAPSNTEPAEELIIDLPEDGGVWYTTLVYGESRQSDPASRRLAAWFATEPRLRSLVAQTKVYQFDVRSTLYRDRYSREMGGETPQIWVQSSDGRVIYKKAGDKIPSDPKALATAISKAIGQCRPGGPCPRPKPAPTPEPTPDVVPVDQPPVIDDVGPDPTPAEVALDDIPPAAWGLLAVPVIAALVALLLVRRK